MNREELKERFKKFALRIFKLVQALPNTSEGNAVRRQLFRSGTSSACNYRAACRARSKLEFIAKLGIVEEELDESMFWLEIISDTKMLEKRLISPLYEEANELLAITIKSKITARNKEDK